MPRAKQLSETPRWKFGEEPFSVCSKCIILINVKLFVQLEVNSLTNCMHYAGNPSSIKQIVLHGSDWFIDCVVHETSDCSLMKVKGNH